jgi:hypothetical protein
MRVAMHDEEIDGEQHRDNDSEYPIKHQTGHESDLARRGSRDGYRSIKSRQTSGKRWRDIRKHCATVAMQAQAVNL